jgi:hypothetical protein
MENVDFPEVVTQVDTLVGTEDAEREAQQGPQVDGLPRVMALLGQIMDLGVAVVAWGDGVLGAGGKDLVGLEFTVFAPLFGIPRLQVTRRRRRSKSCWSGWGACR